MLMSKRMALRCVDEEERWQSGREAAKPWADGLTSRRPRICGAVSTRPSYSVFLVPQDSPPVAAGCSEVLGNLVIRGDVLRIVPAEACDKIIIE